MFHDLILTGSPKQLAKEYTSLDGISLCLHSVLQMSRIWCLYTAVKGPR